jgi:hypothetical protein
LLKLFTEIEKLWIDAIEFKRFMWFDERADVVAKFIKANQFIHKISVLTVNDCNKGLSSLFAILPTQLELTHLTVACNVLTSETVQKFVMVIPKLHQLRVLDLSFISFEKGAPSKPKENLALRILQ